MEYRALGKSEIKVSAVGLGVMTFGSQTSESEAFEQLDIAYDHGVTLFDTAENYPAPVELATQGQSEEILGKWVRARGTRDRVVIATKVAGPGNGPGNMDHIRGPGRCLNRANIEKAIDESLKRLGTDYIDLYQVHWSERPITTLRRSRFSQIPDSPGQVPIEETLEALTDQVRLGKVRQIGVCNESPWGVMRYLSLAETKSLTRIASIQNSYSLLDRRFEQGLAEISMRENVGLIGFSPLSSGLLTGKYREGKALEGSRSTLFPGFETRLASNLLQTASAYADIADQCALAPATMALAFVRQQCFVTSLLMAASRVDQLISNLRSLDVTLNNQVIKAINAVHDACPNPG